MTKKDANVRECPSCGLSCCSTGYCCYGIGCKSAVSDPAFPGCFLDCLDYPDCRCGQYDSEARRNHSAAGRTARKADTGAGFHPATRPTFGAATIRQTALAPAGRGVGGGDGMDESDDAVLASATNPDGSRRFYPPFEHPATARLREQQERLEAFPDSHDRNASLDHGKRQLTMFESGEDRAKRDYLRAHHGQ